MAQFSDPLRDGLYTATRKTLDAIGYTDIDVIYANEDVLEPEKTYCIINILDYNQTGGVNEATFMHPDSDILESVTHYNIFTQFSIIGKRANVVAPDFRHNVVNNRRCREEFLKENFGMLTRSKLRNIPQKRDTEWVPCFNMDINLSFAINTKQSYDWVEYITVNGEVIRIWNA